MWKETTEIGAAFKEYNFTNSKNKTFTKFVVVVKYRPAGNFMSEKKFKLNVLKPPNEEGNGVQETTVPSPLVLVALVTALVNTYFRFVGASAYN